MTVIDQVANVISSKSVQSTWTKTKNVTCAGALKALSVTGKGIGFGLTKLDAGCGVLNRGTVAFLKKYPNIAATVSLETVIRLSVAEHYKANSSSTDHHIPDMGHHVEDEIGSSLDAATEAVVVTTLV